MALNISNINADSNTPGIGVRPLSAPHPQSPNANNGTKTIVSGVDFNIDDIFNPNLSGNLNINKLSSNNSNTTEPKQDPWQAPPDPWQGPKFAQFGEDTHYHYDTEPTMTVDEVYGESNNQPVVEKQGDYATSSNEKSNVKSSTFGDQDEISVTPTSVTENKGMIGNGAIQSVEGLDFQQKDKASQEVLDSKKKRDDAEAEDKADNMRNKLKTNLFNAKQQDGGEDKDDNIRNKLKGDVDNASQQEGGEDVQIGTSEAEKKFNEEKAERQAELNKKKQAVVDAEKNYNDSKDSSKWLDAQLKRLKNQYEMDLRTADQEISILKNMQKNAKEMNSQGYLAKKLNERSDAYKTMKQKIIELAGERGLSAVKIENTEDLVNLVDTLCNMATESRDNIVSDYKVNEDRIEKQKVKADADSIINKGILDEAIEEANKLEKDFNDWKKTEEEKLKAGTAQEPEPESQPETPQSGAETSYNDAMDAIENSENATPEQKAQAEEVLTNLENSRQELAEAAAKARSGNPADLVAYQEALEKYNKNLKKAQKIGNRWTQTDFNKDFTKAVMDSKDFKVTLSDGTEMEFSDFMTEEVEKSPQYAKAMYEAKAQQYEDKAANATGISKGYYRIKAKIERWKSEWSQTTLGSNFTFADDQVRNQFYQFVDTNMRATYATNNNILNDETGKYSDEDKAAALKDIEQAKALKAAAEAMKASTGVLSGAGDDPSDGIFGTTDVTKLTEDQRMMASIKMFTQAVLGLGISPAANKAYQNYYYLNRGDGSVFENDLDNDGFTWVEEYGNNAAAGLILSAGELGTGVVLLLNPASFSSGANLIIDAMINASNALYGVRNDVEKLESMNNDILKYFEEAENIAESSGNEEAVQEITNAITQIENFELKADEVGNLDNWLEGSGSNTTSNEKFNQSLTYDEWMKLIEADPVMRDYAKKLSAEKKKKDENAKKDNADTGVNS